MLAIVKGRAKAAETTFELLSALGSGPKFFPSLSTVSGTGTTLGFNVCSATALTAELAVPVPMGMAAEYFGFGVLPPVSVIIVMVLRSG